MTTRKETEDKLNLRTIDLSPWENNDNELMNLSYDDYGANFNYKSNKKKSKFNLKALKNSATNKFHS